MNNSNKRMIGWQFAFRTLNTDNKLPNRPINENNNTSENICKLKIPFCALQKYWLSKLTK